MNGVGGRVRFCESCQRRRCIAPHTLCAGCRPRQVEPAGPRSPEVVARRKARQLRRRLAAGVLAGFESW